MGKKKKENNKVLWRVAPLSGLMLFWHVGWVEPLSLSLSLSLSTPAASVCQPPPPPICLTLVCIDARWGEGENTSTKLYAVNRATAFWEDSIHSNAHTDPPLPVLYTRPPPSHLVYPRGFCSSIGQLFFPSTSLCVSCFVLVLFSRIPEFIEGFIGLSRASLLILKSLFAPTFAASSLGDGGGGLLLSLRGLWACVRKSVCVRRRERERRRKKTSETEYIRTCDRRERMALWLWAALALTGRTLMIRNGRLTDWLTDRQTNSTHKRILFSSRFSQRLNQTGFPWCRLKWSRSVWGFTRSHPPFSSICFWLLEYICF